MTEPRVAALAEVTRAAFGCAYPRSTGGHGTCGVTDERVAVLLAALPPCGHEGEIARLRGMYREAADWITDVQMHYVLGPEASPEDIFMVAREEGAAIEADARAPLQAQIERLRDKAHAVLRDGDVALAALDRVVAENARLRKIEEAARVDKVLALQQVRAIVNTLPLTMGHGAVSRIAVLDIVDEAVRRILRAALGEEGPHG